MSTNTGAPNVIDYTSEFTDALALLGRIADALETVAEESVKHTAQLTTLAEESVKQTAEQEKQTAALEIIATEAAAHTAALNAIAAEEAAQTPLVERIAVADEGVWQCCRSGRGDQEAFVEINMRYHNETPEQRWERYEAFLMRDAGIPNGAP